MAKIMSGNWNSMPWMPVKSKILPDGTMTAKQVCFAMEAEGVVCVIGAIENGMPTGPHTHPHEQIAMVIQGECDYYVDGIPYRLTPGSWVNVPPNAVHYAHVYRSQGTCLQMDVFCPSRQSSIDAYKEFLKEQGFDWDSGVKEVANFEQPEGIEVRA
jgi:mannose-6-phosphate isomerase-like protein (cupin superfamily)